MKKFFIFLLLVFAPTVVLAAGFKDSVSKVSGFVGGVGLSSDLSGQVSLVISGALALIGTLFMAFTVYAGFLWLTAGGNSERVEKAQSIIKMAAIGIAIVTSAYVITYYITKVTMGGKEGSGAASNGKSEYCASKGGRCISADEGCQGGTIISGFTDCRCCLPPSASDVQIN